MSSIPPSISKDEFQNCVYCGWPTKDRVENIRVGDAIVITQTPVCSDCKKAYDQGYKDGLDDS